MKKETKTKIKLSRSQWEEMGKKAGWMKKADFMNFDPKDPKNYTPGQTPYTDEEWKSVSKMIDDAAQADDMGMEEEDYLKAHDSNVSRRRHIIVTFSDGDTVETDINGTVEEIRDYYLPYGDRGKAQDYDLAHPEKLRWPIKVEFIS